MGKLMNVGGWGLLVASVLLMVMIPVPASPAMQMEKGDLWIKTALESIMEKDGYFNVDGYSSLDRVHVSVHRAIVKLGGAVLTGDEKGEAEVLAMQVPGVHAVENDIHVIPVMNKEVELEKESDSAIDENPLLDIRELRVRAQDGTVTLEGIAPRGYEEQLADQLVKMIFGVDAVHDKIEVLKRV